MQISKYYNISKNTFNAIIREPIFFVILLTSIFILSILPGVALYSFNEHLKLIIDSAMATTLLFGLIIAVLVSNKSISEELENGIVLLMLSKPISKYAFIIAKIAGVISALFVFVFLCNCTTIISIYIGEHEFRMDMYLLYGFLIFLAGNLLYAGIRNYYFHSSVAATFTKSISILLPIFTLCVYLLYRPVESIDLNNLVRALVLLFFSISIMGVISSIIAIKFNIVVNLIISSLIFFAGLLSNYFFGRFIDESLFSATIYSLLPNWQFFWMADAISAQKIIPAIYIFNSFLYTVIYSAFITLWATVLFQNKEVAK